MLSSDSSSLIPPAGHNQGDHVCHVLLVDDDVELLDMVRQSLEGESEAFEVVTATTGDEAFLRMVYFTPDVVVLDVCLPDMNGIEIMNQIYDIHPHCHIVVLTGHGTSEQREVALRSGAVRFLEKPVDLSGFKRLLQELGQQERAGRGLEGGDMDIMDLVQMMYVCQKSTSIRFVFKRHRGTLRFERGEAVYIDDGSLTGAEAFYNMVLLWGTGRFYTLSDESAGILEQNNWNPTASLLIDAIVFRDDHQIDPNLVDAVRFSSPTTSSTQLPERQEGVMPGNETPATLSSIPPPTSSKEPSMAAIDKLKELAQIDGFAGAALFTPTGEILAMVGGEGTNLKEVGVLANSVLMNAQKASLDMGTGRGQQVHVEAEKAHFLVRCLNEGTDPLRSMPGKAHIHLVLILKSDSSIGLAKMRMNSLIPQMAEDFRS